MDLDAWAESNFGLPSEIDLSRQDHRDAVGATLDVFVSFWGAFKRAAKTLRALQDAHTALEMIGTHIEEQPARLTDIQSEPRELLEARLAEWQAWSKRITKVSRRYPTLAMDELIK